MQKCRNTKNTEIQNYNQRNSETIKNMAKQMYRQLF